VRVLAVTGGHSLDHAAFQTLLDSLGFDIHWVEHPEALDVMAADNYPYDATLHYDMPGVRPEPSAPPKVRHSAHPARRRWPRIRDTPPFTSGVADLVSMGGTRRWPIPLPAWDRPRRRLARLRFQTRRPPALITS